jgi:hypothetical protein
MVDNTTIVIGLLIIVIIVVIIVLIVFNRGNELNVFASLPNYHILNTENNTFVGLINVGISACQSLTNVNCTSLPACNNCNFPIASPFWESIAMSGFDINQSMNIWQFEKLTSNSFTTLQSNQSLVKMINSIYQAQTFNNKTPSQRIGFILLRNDFNPSSSTNYLMPVATEALAKTFLMTQLPNNTFTLQINEGIKSFVSVDPATGYLRVVNDTTTKTVFKLVPLVK